MNRSPIHRPVGYALLSALASFALCSPCIAAGPEVAVGSPQQVGLSLASARNALLRGDPDDALRHAQAAYEGSAEDDPSHLAAAVYLAWATDEVGQHTKALALLGGALTDDRFDGDSLLASVRDDAVALEERILATIARVQITVDPADALVRVDGGALEPYAARPGEGLFLSGTSATSTAPHARGRAFTVLLDPGSHDFELERAGYVAPGGEPIGRVVLIVQAGSSRELPLVLVPPPKPPPKSPEPGLPDAVVRAPWILGAAAAVAGTTFGILALDRGSEMERHCSRARCDATGVALSDERKIFAVTSDVAFGAAVTAAVVGVVLYVRPIDSPSRGASPARAFGIGGSW